MLHSLILPLLAVLTVESAAANSSPPAIECLELQSGEHVLDVEMTSTVQLALFEEAHRDPTFVIDDPSCGEPHPDFLACEWPAPGWRVGTHHLFVFFRKDLAPSIEQFCRGKDHDCELPEGGYRALLHKNARPPLQLICAPKIEPAGPGPMASSSTGPSSGNPSY